MSNIQNWIPKYCELGGVEYTTYLIERIQNAHNFGMSAMSNGTIQLQNIIEGVEVSNTSLQSTYFHELIHQMLDMVGENELSGNEKFVQGLANMLFEFIRTAQWVRIEELKKNKYTDPTSNGPFLK